MQRNLRSTTEFRAQFQINRNCDISGVELAVLSYRTSAGWFNPSFNYFYKLVAIVVEVLTF